MCQKSRRRYLERGHYNIRIYFIVRFNSRKDHTVKDAQNTQHEAHNYVKLHTHI